LARRIPVTEVEAVEVPGNDDLLIHWKKPVRSKASSYSQADWEALPETLLLQQIKVSVNQPGFRTHGFYIITTLLDTKVYTEPMPWPIFISNAGMLSCSFGI
jgi:hypothetical protein